MGGSQVPEYVDALVERIDQLEQEVQRLRGPSDSRATAPAVEAPVSRRRLLGMAGAAAAGAAGAVVASAAPAGAVHQPEDVGLGLAGQSGGSTETGITAAVTGNAFRVDNTATTTVAKGIYVTTQSVTGSSTALQAQAIAGTTNAPTFGIHGTSDSTTGTGVAGEHLAGTGFGYGVQGGSESTGGIGVIGVCAAGTGTTIGVKGEANSSTQGTGVRGEGGFVGVFGQAAAATGIGVWADGGLAPMRLVPHIGLGPPTTGTHQRGELYTDNTGGDIFYCRTGGTPGVWSKLNDQLVSGGVGLNLLPAPSRIYDSRLGFSNPSGAAQGPLAFGAAPRVIDCTQTTPNLPANAFGLLLNLVVTGTAGPAAGALLLWANGQPEPLASSINWSNVGQTVANGTTSACNNQQAIQAKVVAQPGSSTDFVIDVIGYYSSP